MWNVDLYTQKKLNNMKYLPRIMILCLNVLMRQFCHITAQRKPKQTLTLEQGWQDNEGKQTDGRTGEWFQTEDQRKTGGLRSAEGD